MHASCAVLARELAVTPAGRLLRIGKWLAAIAIASYPTPGRTQPALFFYPPPHRYDDGRILASPQTVSLEQATTQFPAIPKMSGVVLVVYWSAICPAGPSCDFSLIDGVVNFWRQRGKEVVLDVVTIGFPDHSDRRSRKGMDGATPEWVLHRVRSYSSRTRILDDPKAGWDQSALFPDFRDNVFVELVSQFVRVLAARYDGNPTITQVRISTGLMGEDNPIIGPLSGLRDFDRLWLAYCENITATYLGAFRKTELEFDIGRLSWAWIHGEAELRSRVDNFIEFLFDHHVMLAFDGLNSDSAQSLANAPVMSPAAHSLQVVKKFQGRGGRSGLEAVQHLEAPQMRNLASIVRAIKDVSPIRLVFFADVAQSAHKGALDRGEAQVKATQETGTAGWELLHRLGYF